MKKNFIITAVAALAAFASGAQAETEHNPGPLKDKEKCYGIAKGGKNDCSWSGGGCHGSAPNDRTPDAWLLLPKGYCERIAGGSLTPPPEAPAENKS